MGPSCNLNQNVHADSTTLGAAVALDMIVYERERKSANFTNINWSQIDLYIFYFCKLGKLLEN